MAVWEPEEIVIKKARTRRTGLVVALVLFACLIGAWLLRDRLFPTPKRVAVLAEHVRSEIIGAGDSLEVIASWRFTDRPEAPQPDSARLEIGLEGADPVVVILPAKQHSDTVRIVAPPVGKTAMGHSCVSAVQAGRLSGDSCTPWQFVRPAVDTPVPLPRADSVNKKPAARGAGKPQPTVLRLVVRPSGRQVDPDIDGKCAEWQDRNPGRSVWIKVNDTAVEACMGPNGKPTVAQFCAFAVLEDGERVKTENSTNSPYCEDMYQAWVRERLS